MAYIVTAYIVMAYIAMAYSYGPYSYGLLSLIVRVRSSSSMTLAVMTRASLGHTGRARRASGLTTLIYALVHIGSVLRIVAAFTGNDPVWLCAGAVAWSGAYALFAAGYAPMLLGHRPRNVLAGHGTPQQTK